MPGLLCVAAVRHSSRRTGYSAGASAAENTAQAAADAIFPLRMCFAFLRRRLPTACRPLAALKSPRAQLTIWARQGDSHEGSWQASSSRRSHHQVTHDPAAMVRQLESQSPALEPERQKRLALHTNNELMSSAP
jgi:hypothetical protein